MKAMSVSVISLIRGDEEIGRNTAHSSCPPGPHAGTITGPSGRDFVSRASTSSSSQGWNIGTSLCSYCFAIALQDSVSKVVLAAELLIYRTLELSSPRCTFSFLSFYLVTALQEKADLGTRMHE